MFFNEKGILNIDEIVARNDSFQKIMEDGIVTLTRSYPCSKTWKPDTRNLSCLKSSTYWLRPVFSMLYTN